MLYSPDHMRVQNSHPEKARTEHAVFPWDYARTIRITVRYPVSGMKVDLLEKCSGREKRSPGFLCFDEVGYNIYSSIAVLRTLYSLGQRHEKVPSVGKEEVGIVYFRDREVIGAETERS